MNTTEKIVESYFRLRHRCFTMADVKVHGGNNRQLDLLAYGVGDSAQYHIEIGVTHVPRFQPDVDKLEKKIQFKFFGEARELRKTAARKRVRKPARNYFHQIIETYRYVGFEPPKVQRIWVTWQAPDVEKLAERLREYCKNNHLDDYCVRFMSFRDEIVPELFKDIRTANYSDDALRTLSLLQQCDRQTKAGRELGRQSRLKHD